MIAKIKSLFLTPSLILPFTAGFVFLLALISPNSYTGSDAHFSLLVSQALIEHGTVQLDNYLPNIQDQLPQFGYQLQQINGLTYYAFPSGTSFLMTPFVGLANLFGFDMAQTADNYLWQNLLSAVICAAIFLLLYKICLCYTHHATALAITLITLLGSSLISTLATALWSLDLAVLCISATLLPLCRHATGQIDRPNPFLIGIFLCAAFLCRPTSAVFILITFAYLWRYSRPTLWPTAAIAAASLALFFLFNLSQSGDWIPAYYLPQRLGNATSDLPHYSFLQKLNGILLSPGRGLLPFTPWVTVVFAGCLVFGRSIMPKRPWFVLALIWWTAHLAIISSFPHWWGGYSYGPRLLTDSLPAVVLLSAILADPIRRAPGRTWWLTSFVTLGLFSIWVHSGQGLFNVNTTLWNATPSIDKAPEYLFDWRSPQFFATAASNTRRWAEYTRSAYSIGQLDLPPYQIGTSLSFDSAEANYIGWWSPSPGTWWSDSGTVHVFFKLPAVQNAPHRLILTSDALQSHTVVVSLNGNWAKTIMFDSEQTTQQIEIENSWLLADNLNQLTLNIDPASYPLQHVPEVGIRAARHRIALKNTRLTFEIAN